MAAINNIEIPSLLLAEQSGAPTTPATGFGRIYAKSTGLFFVGDDGVEIGPLGAGGGGATAVELLHVRDEKASGTSGGTSTATAWTTRTINTVKTNEITGASLASDLITLPAGTYEADITAAFYSTNRCKQRLRNATAGTTLLSGRSDYGGGGVGQSARIVGRFTLASSSDVRLEYYVESSSATIGLGVPSSSGEVEVYADVLIRRIS